MSVLGSALLKLSKPNPELADAQDVNDVKGFTPLSEVKSIDKKAMLDELVALNAVTEKTAEEVTSSEAASALSRLHKLEREKPTAGQVARGAAAGAIAAPAVTLVREAVGGGLGKGVREAWKGRGVKGKLLGLGKGLYSGGRQLAGASAGTAAAFGSIPIIRGHLDREAEKEKLRQYLGTSKRGKLRRKIKRTVGV